MHKKLAENLSIIVFAACVIFLGSNLVGGPSNTIEGEGGYATLHFFDVGQGDAALLELPEDHQVLIDGGPDKSILTELGEVMPAYDKKIEAVFLSHPHADHLAGLNYILDRYEVDVIYLNGLTANSPDFEAFMERVKEQKQLLKLIYRGEKIDLSEANVEILWPPKETVTNYDLNDSSLILYLYYGNNTVLFTGDASAKIQEGIGEDLKNVDILKVSHHGSATGTSENIIKTLKPRYAIISSGEGNRFGHPAKNILEMLSFTNVFRTDTEGAVSFKLTGKDVFAIGR